MRSRRNGSNPPPGSRCRAWCASAIVRSAKHSKTILLPIAQRTLSELAGGLSEFARFVAGYTGTITVAALPSIAAILLPGALNRFAAAHPSVDVRILDGLSNSIVSAVLDGHADIGLTAQPPPGETLSFHPLLSDQFGLVCRLDDPLAASKRTLNWSVFAGRPFVAMASTSSVRAMTDAAFLQAGLAVVQRYECAFLGTTGHLVSAGLGITALPRLALPLTAAPDLVWRPLRSPVMRRPIGALTLTRRTLAPAAVQFLDDLRIQASSLQLSSDSS